MNFEADSHVQMFDGQRFIGHHDPPIPVRRRPRRERLLDWLWAAWEDLRALRRGQA
jgi:hypothetical protein